jgi:hypothetical protein
MQVILGEILRKYLLVQGIERVDVIGAWIASMERFINYLVSQYAVSSLCKVGSLSSYMDLYLLSKKTN